jgi:cytochrome c oxidase subunit 1
VTFFPQHLLGLDGMIRRIADYAPNAGWTELNILSTIGAFTIMLSILPFLWNVFITLRGPQNALDDPWDGYTLEWATTSPPPAWNFEVLPPVRSERPLFDLKHRARPAHTVAIAAVSAAAPDATVMADAGTEKGAEEAPKVAEKKAGKGHSAAPTPPDEKGPKA